MDALMFNAISQASQDYDNKQAMIANQYTNEVDLFNQQKKQIDQYNKNMKAAAREQLNNLVGSDFAEAGIYTIMAGKQLYRQYKTARAAREDPLAADQPPKTGYKVGVGGDVKLAPKPVANENEPVRPEAPKPQAGQTVDVAEPPKTIAEKSRLGIASNVDQARPAMVTSSAQTDTPVMKLKGGVKGPLEEDRLIYDPNEPGMIKIKDSAAPGGYREYTSREDELARQLDAQQKQLEKTSVTRRAARQRRIREQGGDPDDIDLPARGEAPPRIRFATDRPTPQVSFEQRITETPAEAAARRASAFRARLTASEAEQPRNLRSIGDPEIQVRPRRAATLTRDPDLIKGFDPRDPSASARPRAKTLPSKEIPGDIEPFSKPKSLGTNIEKYTSTPLAPKPEPNTISSEPPQPATQPPAPQPEPAAGPKGAAAQAPEPTQPVQAAQAPAQPEAQVQAKVNGEPATPDEPAKPPSDSSAPKDISEGATEAGGEAGGMGAGDLLGLAGLGYGIYEEAESKDTTPAKVANIAGQVGLFAGIEAAEMAVPGAGPVLGALTAVGFGLYDLFSKKHQEEANPAPVKGPPPVVAPHMAFDSAPTLDSSAFRQPLGGIVQ